jgi:hypothetical protein
MTKEKAKELKEALNNCETYVSVNLPESNNPLKSWRLMEITPENKAYLENWNEGKEVSVNKVEIDTIK